MNNEIEQLAQKNDMSIEFVTWFFNEKKAVCGNVWFMMMAAMWEGWKGRSIEMDKLAAENVVRKNGNGTAIEFRDFYAWWNILNEDGLRTEEERMLAAGAWMARSGLGNTDEYQYVAPETPTTDRIVAGIKADGVEEFAAKLRIPGDDQFFDALAKGVALAADDFAKQLREGDNHD